MRPVHTLVGLVAIATASTLLAACSGESSSGTSAPTSSSTGDASTTPDPAEDQVDATRITEVSDQDELAPGLYAMGFSSPDPDTPLLLIDVPAGFSGRGDGYEISAGGDDLDEFRHLDTWTVDEVATRACGPTDWVDPGPGVDDLADALTALDIWETTEPLDVTIGGHAGVSMELNVPEDLPSRCGDQPASFRDHVGSTQGVAPGKDQRLWIVEVDGQRLVLLAGYFPGPRGTTPEQVAELTGMVERASFVDTDQVP